MKTVDDSRLKTVDDSRLKANLSMDETGCVRSTNRAEPRVSGAWIPEVGDLATKGYLVVRSFLDEREIALFESDIARNEGVWYESFLVKIPPRDLLLRCASKFDAVTAAAAKQTDIEASFLIGGVYFFTEGGQRFLWHQDRESYYFSQTHYQYLNFYIPIIKPDVSKSYLSLVPMDRFRRRSPDMWARPLGRGACLVECSHGKSVFLNENDRGVYGCLSYDLAELAETPELNAGDLLLVRGDVIHRTQDADTMRVALSVRFTQGSHKVSKAKLVDGGFKKFTKMLEMPAFYQSLLAYFDARGVEEIPFEDFYSSEFSTFCGTCRGTRASLRNYLLAEKLRYRLWGSLTGVGMGAIRAGAQGVQRRARSWLKARLANPAWRLRIPGFVEADAVPLRCRCATGAAQRLRTGCLVEFSGSSDQTRATQTLAVLGGPIPGNDIGAIQEPYDLENQIELPLKVYVVIV